MRLVIIGAGPIGLESALYGARLGFDVRVLEAGAVGESVRRWGHVKLFSPWRMNVSPLGLEVLREAGLAEPPSEEYPSGLEHRGRYLLPLVEAPALAGRVETGVRVVAIGRDRLRKGEWIGEGRRAGYPFRLLVARNGEEDVIEADLVMDASGTYGLPNRLGNGGIPAPGERQAGHRISYGLDDVLGADRADYAGKRTLVVGAGHSAATSAMALMRLAREEPGTEVVWIIRQPLEAVYQPFPDDPLPERDRLIRQARALLESESPGLLVQTGTVVEAIHSEADALRVILRGEGAGEVRVDRILANVGYGPDSSLYRELQVHECYATRGPMALAAVLLGESSADCLAQTSHGPESLRSPEPNFFILGAKAYGLNPHFLIRIGLGQIRDVFRLLTGDPSLDLYEEVGLLRGVG